MFNKLTSGSLVSTHSLQENMVVAQCGIHNITYKLLKIIACVEVHSPKSDEGF